MTLLGLQNIERNGITPAFTAPSASDTFVPGLKTFYYARVGSTPTTFTFVIPSSKQLIPDVHYANVVVGPITSQDKLIGPFPPQFFRDDTTGVATVNSNNQTGVTVAVFGVDETIGVVSSGGGGFSLPLDGGSPSTSFTDIVDGGAPSTTYTLVLDGGTP